jgi:AcrR family transcriptional regulator
VARHRAERPGIILPGGRPPGGPDRVVPRGHRGQRSEEVRQIQWAKIIDAFVREVGRRGLPKTEIRVVCQKAGVSLDAFYRLFGRKIDCALTAFSIGSGIVCDLGEVAFRQTEGAWEVRLHAAISAMLDLLAHNPAFARLALVDLPHDAEAVEHFNDVVARCRTSFGGTGELATPVDVDVDAYETVLVGGVLWPLEYALSQGRGKRLPELAKTVTWTLALPAVGHERANELLCRI